MKRTGRTRRLRQSCGAAFFFPAVSRSRALTMWSTFMEIMSPTLPVNGIGSLLFETNESKMTERAILTTTLMCHVFVA